MTSRRRVAMVAAGALSFALWLMLSHALSHRVRGVPPTPASYADAVAMIARRQAADDRLAAPGARSILLSRGRRTTRTVVLLHGFTDSPRQFEPLAHRLHADGNNVFVPRVPQHGLRGGNAGSLARLTASQLRGFGDSVVSEAAGLGDSVVVLGLSLGGTLAAWIGQKREISRAVPIAPALEPGRVPAILDRPIVELVDWLPNVTRRSPGDPDRPDREPGFSTHGIAELLELGESVIRSAAREAPRTQQFVVLVNASDRTVRESAAEALARNWARHGAMVSVLELPDSLHLPHNVVDPTRGRVLGPAMLDLLRALTYGEQPSALVRTVPVR